MAQQRQHPPVAADAADMRHAAVAWGLYKHVSSVRLSPAAKNNANHFANILLEVNLIVAAK